MDFLVDENMPRSLASQIAALGFRVRDVRDIGLRGEPDSAVFEAALAADEIIITRDRGFTREASWPQEFTGGVIFVNLPDDFSAKEINSRVISLLSSRTPGSLLGAVTMLQISRALSRPVRRRN